MPNQPPHSCGNNACKTPAPAGQTYCDACQAKRGSATRQRDPEIEKLYNSKRWRETSPLVKSKNPICQRLDDSGRQCTHASAVVHHLVDPKVNATIFFDWQNLVAVCTQHHAGGQPGERQGEKYCHTLGVLDSVYKHGYLWPAWHKNYEAPPADQALVSVFTSAVGAAAIARALAS